mmetsp:Transcript_16174/g.41873  ORF Transcript_16174/g.41873 Transcript_16174/m.41873 type:complete len:202 (-) Transcript_16174:12-617(-)
MVAPVAHEGEDHQPDEADASNQGDAELHRRELEVREVEEGPHGPVGHHAVEELLLVLQQRIIRVGSVQHAVLERIVERQVDHGHMNQAISHHLLDHCGCAEAAAKDAGEEHIVDDVLATSQVCTREHGESNVSPAVHHNLFLHDFLADAIAGRALDNARAKRDAHRKGRRGPPVCFERPQQQPGSGKHAHHAGAATCQRAA